MIAMQSGRGSGVELKHLASLVRIVELKSFTTAARSLHISQPALGLQIRKLEEELGTQLLHRHSWGVEPTAAGLMLLDEARTILQRVARVKQSLLEHATLGRSTVAIGLPRNAFLSAELVRRCRDAFPQLSLLITEDRVKTLFDLLESDAVEFACVYQRPSGGHIAYESLLIERLYLIGARPDVRTEDGTITFAEAVSRPLILPRAGSGLHRYLAKLAAEANVSLNIAHETQSEALGRQLMRQGLGQTINGSLIARHYVEQEGLSARAITDPAPAMKLGLIHKTTRPLSLHGRWIAQVIRSITRDEASLRWDGTAG